jgi:hypothetical protein
LDGGQTRHDNDNAEAVPLVRDDHFAWRRNGGQDAESKVELFFYPRGVALARLQLEIDLLRGYGLKIGLK